MQFIKGVLTFVTRALVFFALWLLMSGVYKPLVVGLGVASAVLAALVVTRMERAAPGARLEAALRPFALLRYLGWLLVEIAKSNWRVTKAIMSPSMPIRQHYFTVPFAQRTEFAQTTFANSITLTPGTVTVEIEEDFFWVHAICYDASDHDALAEMDRQVKRTEAS